MVYSPVRLDLRAELAAGRGRALRLAAADIDAPAADPADIAAERQIQRRFHAAGVVGDAALPGLEFVERDDIGDVAAAAAGDDAIGQCQGLADHQLLIDRRDRYAIGKRSDRGEHLVGIALTITPAVMKLVAQTQVQA